MKVKVKKGNAEKFANTPQYCYVDNSNITGKSIPNHLDRQWYIELAHERLRQFGGN
jgi:DNA polymerase